MGVTPTQLSKRKLEAEGYTVEITERWNSFAKIRQDMWGFVDLVGLKENETLAVQTTSYDNVSKRVNKIADHPNVDAVRKAGWRIVVHGWHKKDNRWTCREVDLS